MAMIAPMWQRMLLAVELPILTQALRARMRGKRVFLLLFIASALAVGLGLAVLYFQLNAFTSTGGAQEMGQRIAKVGHSLFASLAVLEMVLIIILTPALTAGAIAQERERGTLEMLLLTRLSSLNLLLGKLCSALSLPMTIILCAVPVGAIAFLLGGVSPAEVVGSLGLLVATMLLFGCISLMCSVHFRKMGAALVASYLMCLAWVGWLPALAYFASAIGEQAEFMAFVSIASGMVSFAIVLIVRYLASRTHFRWGYHPSVSFLLFLVLVMTAVMLIGGQYRDYKSISYIVLITLGEFSAIIPASVMVLLHSLARRRVAPAALFAACWLPCAGFWALVYHALFMSGGVIPLGGYQSALSTCCFAVAALLGLGIAVSDLLMLISRGRAPRWLDGLGWLVCAGIIYAKVDAWSAAAQALLASGKYSGLIALQANPAIGVLCLADYFAYWNHEPWYPYMVPLTAITMLPIAGWLLALACGRLERIRRV